MTDDTRRSRTPAEIEREIEQTRERMSNDIEAIGERFTPAHLKARARVALRDAREAAMEKVQEVAHDVGTRAREAGSGVVQAVRRNPVPAALIGVGVAWMIAGRREPTQTGRYRRRASDRATFRTSVPGEPYERYETAVEEASAGVGERVAEAKDTVKEKARELGQQAGARVRQAADQAGTAVRQARQEARSFFEENPLVAALAVAALGAAIGSLLPRTERERRLMGPARDTVVGRVKDSAQRVTDRAKEATQEVLDSFSGAVSGGTRQPGAYATSRPADYPPRSEPGAPEYPI